MRKAMLVLAILALVVPVVAGCATPPAPTAAPANPEVVEKVITATPPPPEAPTRPNVVRVNFGPGDVPTLDPGVAEDTSSITAIEECYVGLTRLDEVTSALQPGMATSWDMSEDGLTYTFHLRDDIPWVRWDGTQVVKVQDCEGNDRMVTAFDFEYGILRALAPETASPYAYVLDFAIDGAAAFTNDETDDPTTVGVKALDATTLEINFVEPAAYNANIAGLWTAFPVPKWLIEGDDCTEARGERWIEPGFYQGFGPFALKEWIHDSTLTVVKNPFWPGTEAVPQPELDEVTWTMLDAGPAMAEYEAGNLDVAGVPLADMDRVKADPVLSSEFNISPSLCTYFYGFNVTAPVVDDVRVRRALSMAIDRQGLVDNVLKGGQEPAQWLARPGLAAAPTMADHPDLGVKTNIEEGKKVLDEYLQEKGTTADQLDITLVYNTSEGHQKIAEFIQQQWKVNLGIDVKVTNQEWKVFLETTKGPQTPQVYRMGWCLDYPDANNFTREVVASGGSNNPVNADGSPQGGLMWKNDDFEQLVVDAAREQDPAKRVELYAQAEQILCWDDAAIIPLYWYTSVAVTKPYVNRTYSVGGHQRYEKWSVSQD